MTDVINITDSRYPRLLKQINDPPDKLYYKGNWETSLFDRCLAVVGSRRMTTYGKSITNKLVAQIASTGITIVSGFMYGIDATAHKAAVDAGGRTIAVMPCGIDVVHPEHQKSLYEEILENNGLIISEFEADFSPAIWTYPRRNRIIAGLSFSTMVVEAAEKSGSLITAGFAKKYKRKLFAVPGPLTSITSIGTAKLLKEGADIVTGAEDVIKEYGLTTQKTIESHIEFKGLDKLGQRIVEELQREPMEIDTLLRIINTPISKLSTALSLLELKGILFEERGKYILRHE